MSESQHSPSPRRTSPVLQDPYVGAWWRKSNSVYESVDWLGVEWMLRNGKIYGRGQVPGLKCEHWTPLPAAQGFICCEEQLLWLALLLT